VPKGHREEARDHRADDFKQEEETVAVAIAAVLVVIEAQHFAIDDAIIVREPALTTILLIVSELIFANAMSRVYKF